MGVRNQHRETIERLETQDSRCPIQCRNPTRPGLFPLRGRCRIGSRQGSLFPVPGSSDRQIPPGKVTLVAVAADEPAGKPVAACQKQTVCLTLHRGQEDDRLISQRGPAAFRQDRFVDLCQQALSQGGLLTAEDLAYRVFFVTPRTISRDLLVLRKANPQLLIPMRSTLHDIGPVLTHRTQIIRLALQGKTTSQICQIMHHSPEAVANYLSTFTRCAQLARKKLQIGQIAFILRRGPALVSSYLDLLAECRRDRNPSTTSKNCSGWEPNHTKKKPLVGGPPMGSTPDFIRKKFGPLRDKTLKNALASDRRPVPTHRPAPLPVRRDGLGIRRATCAPKNTSRTVASSGWPSADNPPRHRQRIADTDLVPVLLDLSTPDDIDRRIARAQSPTPPAQGTPTLSAGLRTRRTAFQL